MAKYYGSIPSPNQQIKICPTYDETYDEIAVKTVSNCLARMKGYWDPEFDPSIQEIMDYGWCMAILSVCFLWRACTLGGFPYSV